MQSFKLPPTGVCFREEGRGKTSHAQTHSASSLDCAICIQACVCVSVCGVCVPSPTWEQILAAFLRIYPCKGGPSPRTPWHLPSEAGGEIILSKWNSRLFSSPKQTILRHTQVEECLGAVGVLPCEIMMCFIPAYKRENSSSGRTHNCMMCISSEISTRNT